MGVKLELSQNRPPKHKRVNLGLLQTDSPGVILGQILGYQKDSRE